MQTVELLQETSSLSRGSCGTRAAPRHLVSRAHLNHIQLWTWVQAEGMPGCLTEPWSLTQAAGASPECSCWLIKQVVGSLNVADRSKDVGTDLCCVCPCCSSDPSVSAAEAVLRSTYRHHARTHPAGAPGEATLGLGPLCCCGHAPCMHAPGRRHSVVMFLFHTTCAVPRHPRMQQKGCISSQARLPRQHQQQMPQHLLTMPHLHRHSSSSSASSSMPLHAHAQPLLSKHAASAPAAAAAPTGRPGSIWWCDRTPPWLRHTSSSSSRR